METSTLAACRLTASPRLLLCAQCLRGGSTCKNAKRAAVLLARVVENPDVHITLEGAFDEVGARTARFDAETPDERRRDLWTLQALGLCFGDTRTARDLFLRLDQRVKSLADVCGAGPWGLWPGCPAADGVSRAKGAGFIPKKQAPDVMTVRKTASCAALRDADRIVIRAHHLLCVTCFAGRGKPDEPLAEDNLCEVMHRLINEPSLPVTLIEGPGACVVCPPCHSFDPERGLCVAACHLRDRKKDLDTFRLLGCVPGDTLPASEILKHVRERIPHTEAVCGFETDNSPEWASCGGCRTGAYERGLDYIRTHEKP